MEPVLLLSILGKPCNRLVKFIINTDLEERDILKNRPKMQITEKFGIRLRNSHFESWWRASSWYLWVLRAQPGAHTVPQHLGGLQDTGMGASGVSPCDLRGCGPGRPCRWGCCRPHFAGWEAVSVAAASLRFLIRVASTLSTRVGASKGSQHRRRAAGPNGRMGRRGGKACCWWLRVSKRWMSPVGSQSGGLARYFSILSPMIPLSRMPRCTGQTQPVS